MQKIDIIMGIHNCQDTLSEAINSIIAQSFTDWQLIMCDDGSTDKTYEIALEYEKNNPDRIILLKNKRNQGLNYTLNKCLKETTAKYVARMDGDDISLVDRLEKEFVFLENHPEYAIVSTAMLFFDEKGIWGQNTVIEVPKISDFVFHPPFHCHAPCMIRRDAFLEVGGYTVDKRLLRYEDCDLWYKLYSAGHRGYNIKEPLYMMRDDRNAYKRRTVSSRIRSVYVQWHGFTMINMPFYYYPYLALEFIKSVCLAVIPEKVYIVLHRIRKKRLVKK